jgi:17beta-estradiol 17-dehydrogenase / very-long-chain 3-oxoacyl-CoA reductase
VAALTYKTSSILYKTWLSWGWVPSHFQNEAKLNGPALKNKYGDCWVVITGFTQGIGRGFAEIFAELGFNLLLISRNEDRCKLKVQELQQRYKDIQIKYASCNMADKKEIPHLERIFEEWKNLDIGIVVNNAGTVAGGPYFSIQPEMLVDDINIDLLAVFLINRIIVPKMRTRGQRSAILNVASCTGVYLSPRVGVYSSTKRSIDVYSRILDLENNDKIDVLSVRPFGVTTYMMKMKKGPFMITPRVCAFSSLADLLAGKKTTFTGFKHKISEVAFKHLTEDESFALYDYYWAQARAQAAD